MVSCDPSLGFGHPSIIFFKKTESTKGTSFSDVTIEYIRSEMEEQFDKAYILELADKINKGTITDLEWQYYNKWYDSASYELLELPEGIADDAMVIRDRMHESVMSQLVSENPVKTLRLPGIGWKSAAAAVILIAALFFLMNRNQFGSVKLDMAAVRQDIAPGRQSATLTLADGKKIVLSDAKNGELAQEAGLRITKAADGQLVYELKDQGWATENKLNTLSTSNGETYRLRLPDGSLVWLNAASSLTYAFALNEHGERQVKLNGEAYFEIAKDKAHPFVVTTDRQQVKVLGTHFNVNSYSDEPKVLTTLLEGSVKVSQSETGNYKLLKPNEQAILLNGNFKTIPINPEDAIAWKNGLFTFGDESLENIMKRVARWYNVSIEYQQGVDKNELYGGSVSRSEKVSKVLAHLEATGGIHFKVEGRRVLVTK